MWKKIELFLLSKLMRTKFYSWLLLKVIPYVRFTTYYTSMRGITFHAGRNLIRPGDIVLTLDNKKLTALLISRITGQEGFCHAAFCVSTNEVFEVAEMTHTNFTKSCFFDICKESTRVCILRCKDFDADYIKKMVDRTPRFEHASYDVLFNFGVDALYCSELVYEYDFERRLKVDLTPLIGDQPYISPMGLYQAKNVEIVWDSDWEMGTRPKS